MTLYGLALRLLNESERRSASVASKKKKQRTAGDSYSHDAQSSVLMMQSRPS